MTRSDATTDYTFVLNHGRGELTVDVPARRRRPAHRRPLDRPAHPRPFGAAVLATPRAATAPFITLSDTTD